MKLPQVRTRPMVDSKPDLELTTDDMIAVHRWLEFALEDSLKQARMMKPSAIQTKQTQAKFAMEQLGFTFLRNWLTASLNQIENQLEAAGVIQPVTDGSEEIH